MRETIRLHDYQDDIKQRLSEAWKQHRSVMVQMPTGTGKTYVLASIVNEELRMKNEEFVWIIAHRRELVAQIEETVSRMLTSTSNSSFFILRSSFIKVFSIQWLSRHWEDIKDNPSLIIIDEAHHAQAKTYRMLWDRFPKAKFLGLTATPCRMNGIGFTDLFDTLITSWSIAEFIEKGYLSVFDYVAIRANSEEQRLIDSLEKRGADGDYQIKEMDSVLNRLASIELLFHSVERFARGKKGIVYAVSIAHARKIATYYNSRGMAAVAIDSKTPAMERKRMVEDFKNGKIKVLVNVDVFSEGFDCPDVEFVQMARPTLSLSKYLQQVGRGLRRSAGKETCILIDNVGLYRVFGLPVAAWDWEAMFRGTMSGKGNLMAEERSELHVSSESVSGEESTQECDMEIIVSHEQLLSDIKERKEMYPVLMNKDACRLKAWRDERSRLWGLQRGKKRTTDARFLTVFDIRYDMAAVRFPDYSCGLVNESGNIIWKKNGCRTIRFLKDNLMGFVLSDGRKYYVDLHNLHTYDRKPIVMKFGNVELLKIDSCYYSRTQKVYVNNQNINDSFISFGKFCVGIFDCKTPFFDLDNGKGALFYRCGYACILESDSDNYYWLHRRLKDGSIIVVDDDGKFYQATDGSLRYIGCRDSAEECRKCRMEMECIVELAEKRKHPMNSGKAEIRQQLLARPEEAHPFCSGRKWGLRIGNRVTIPPVYRNIQSPVGKYCAVEKNYGQWGVVALDGTWMVEPKYSDIEISVQGIVTGTKVTGSKERMKLP